MVNTLHPILALVRVTCPSCKKFYCFPPARFILLVSLSGKKRSNISGNPGCPIGGWIKKKLQHHAAMRRKPWCLNSSLLMEPETRFRSLTNHLKCQQSLDQDPCQLDNLRPPVRFISVTLEPLNLDGCDGTTRSIILQFMCSFPSLRQLRGFFLSNEDLLRDPCRPWFVPGFVLVF